ncbi:hypothetical protein EON63_05695 [archaeon]|nr:MAG: hypothetical protein EON63_05695 [archaeon]
MRILMYIYTYIFDILLHVYIGLDVKVEGLTRELLQDTRCFIMAFTHACNIDGFLVAGMSIHELRLYVIHHTPHIYSI